MDRLVKIKRPWLAAAALGLVTLLMSFGYWQIQTRSLKAYREPVPVLIAKRDFQPGQILDEAWVEQSVVPRSFLQPSALNIPAAVNGMAALGPIAKGEQIMASKLAPPGSRTGLSMQIPEGRRALSLKVDAASEVGIRPNNFVDVLSTFTLETDLGETKVAAYTVAQRVLVLAVGEDFGRIALPNPSQKKWDIESLTRRQAEKTVTLALTPEQVQKVALAAHQGEVVLALRPQQEEETNALRPTSLFELTGVAGQSRREQFREYRGR